MLAFLYGKPSHQTKCLCLFGEGSAHIVPPPPLHGASHLVQAMSSWWVRTRHGPSRHCRDAMVYGHATTARHDMSTPPPPPATILAPLAVEASFQLCQEEAPADLCVFLSDILASICSHPLTYPRTHAFFFENIVACDPRCRDTNSRGSHTRSGGGGSKGTTTSKDVCRTVLTARHEGTGPGHGRTTDVILQVRTES